jgi:hypothetical protein
MQEAVLVINEQITHFNLKKIEIQITPEEGRAIDETLKRLQKT